MSSVVTIRPITLAAQAGAVGVVPSGTIPGVLADNSDSTYVTTGTGQGQFTVRCGTAVLPADHQWNAVRARIRAQANSTAPPAGMSVRRGGGPGGDTGLVLTSTIQGFATPWVSDAVFGLDRVSDLSDLDLNFLGGQTVGDRTRVMEGYLDLDARHVPVFTADVLDGAGNSAAGGIVSDTNDVRFTISAPDYDGLLPGPWSVALHDGVGAFLWQVGGGVSAPPPVLTDWLPEGSYEARFSVASWIRGTGECTTTTTLLFEVSIPDPPAGPAVTATQNGPVVDVCWEPAGDPPNADEGSLVTQIRRTDCSGTAVIGAVPEQVAGCFADRFVTFARGGVWCEDPEHVCCVTYEARYTYLDGGVRITGAWVGTGGVQFISAAQITDETPPHPEDDPTEPPGAAEGDLLLMFYVQNVGFDPPEPPTPPPGWVEVWSTLYQWALPSENERLVGVWAITRGPSAPSFQWSDGPGFVGWKACVAYRGASVADADGALGGTSPSLNGAAGQVLVAGAFTESGFDNLPPDGMLSRLPHVGSWMRIADQPVEAGGPTGPRVWPVEDGWEEPGASVSVLLDPLGQSLCLDNPTPGMDWLAGVDSGDLAVCTTKTWARNRPADRHVPITGGPPTVRTGAPSGRDFTVTITTTTLDELHALEEVLAQDLVWYRPADLPAQWCAPVTESVQVVQVGRVRQTTVTLLAAPGPVI